jgi:hypothetical protein
MVPDLRRVMTCTLCGCMLVLLAVEGSHGCHPEKPCRPPHTPEDGPRFVVTTNFTNAATSSGPTGAAQTIAPSGIPSGGAVGTPGIIVKPSA